MVHQIAAPTIKTSNRRRPRKNSTPPRTKKISSCKPKKVKQTRTKQYKQIHNPTDDDDALVNQSPSVDSILNSVQPGTIERNENSVPDIEPYQENPPLPDEEDIRTAFIARAMNCYTNAQLLLARDELLRLKIEKPQRWMRWALAAPIATGVIRDLYDI